jgi:5'(3')-deoxyribonucleotidase
MNRGNAVRRGFNPATGQWRLEPTLLKNCRVDGLDEILKNLNVGNDQEIRKHDQQGRDVGEIFFDKHEHFSLLRNLCKNPFFFLINIKTIFQKSKLFIRGNEVLAA